MSNTFQILQENLPKALADTALMLGISGLLGVLLGGALGLFLFVTKSSLFLPLPWLNRIIGFIVNAIRSFPFLILMIVVIPLATFLIGDPYTPLGGSVSLTIAAIPFFARIAEGAFSEIDHGILEAAVASGATLSLITREVLLPEALPSLIRGIVLTFISLLGYSAMLGTISAGGIGDLAIQFGYNRYETGVLIVVVLLLIILVQLIQWLGDALAKAMTK